MRIEFNISDQEVDFECPACGQKFRVKVVDLLDPEKVTPCPSCGQLFRSRQSLDDFQRGAARAAERAVARQMKRRKKRK